MRCSSPLGQANGDQCIEFKKKQQIIFLVKRFRVNIQYKNILLIFLILLRDFFLFDIEDVFFSTKRFKTCRSTCV